MRVKAIRASRRRWRVWTSASLGGGGFKEDEGEGERKGEMRWRRKN